MLKRWTGCGAGVSWLKRNPSGTCYIAAAGWRVSPSARARLPSGEESITGKKLTTDDPARERWGPYLLLGAVILAVALAAWRPIPVGVWHDDGVYALVGRAVAEGHGFTYQGVVGAPPAVKVPPVYPSFVAGLWWLSGDVGTVTLVATLANLLFLAAAGVLLARALRVGAGLPRLVAMPAGGLAVVSADVLRTSSAVLSEPLFLMLASGCLAWWATMQRRASHAGDGGAPATGAGTASAFPPAHLLLLGGLLLLTVGTRAAGLALVAGFGLAAVLRGGLRAAAPVLAPPLLAWVGWSLWAGARGATLPADLADLLGPYEGWLRQQVLNDPAGFVARLPAHVAGVLERVFVLWLPRLGGVWLWVAAIPLVAAAAAGWTAARVRLPPLAWSALAYLGLLLAWPYLDRRLVVPLHVLAVGLMAMGVIRLREGPAPAWVRRTAVGVVLAWTAFYSVVTVHRIAVEWPTAGYRIRAERMAAGVEALRRVVPEGAVVGAPEFWAGLHLHGGWTVAPSVLFDPASVDAERPSWGSPEEQERLWRDTGIEYLLLEQGGALHGATLDVIEARCPGALAVLARMPGMMVVRLPWASGPDGKPVAECPTA